MTNYYFYYTEDYIYCSDIMYNTHVLLERKQVPKSLPFQNNDNNHRDDDDNNNNNNNNNNNYYYYYL